MRTVTVSLYLYDELPTDKAKETARDWLDTCLQSDPDTSDFQKIIDLIETWDPADLRGIAHRYEDCPLTGFFADHDGLEAIHKAMQADPDTPVEELRRAGISAVNAACDADRESKREKEYLEEMLRANEYEFTADGKRSPFPEAKKG